MMFRDGGEIEQPKVAWRRPTLFEAFLAGCCVFTWVMIFRVAWDAFQNENIDYGTAFFQACCLGTGYMFGGLIFKSRMVFLR